MVVTPLSWGTSVFSVDRSETYITAVTPQRSTRHRLSRTAFTVTAVFSGTLPSALPLAL